MQKTERKPLFDLGQFVATPGALAALEKSGQTPMEFLERHIRGENFPKKTKPKTSTAWKKGSGC